jgi:hypothetical protein
MKVNGSKRHPTSIMISLPRKIIKELPDYFTAEMVLTEIKPRKRYVHNNVRTHIIFIEKAKK